MNTVNGVVSVNKDLVGTASVMLKVNYDGTTTDTNDATIKVYPNTGVPLTIG